MKPASLKKEAVQKLWLDAQGLLKTKSFGSGALATPKAVRQLGYLQIDTINVIERCHHHILFTRIPDYQRSHLKKAQTIDKTLFEYWTHALAYVPSEDFRFFMKSMKAYEKSPDSWYSASKKSEVTRVFKLIKDAGPISIRDIKDEVLLEKNHPWASRKPSKRVLQFGFHTGNLVISERQGMLKKYELTDRHFNWQTRPKPASEKEILAYRIDRALTAQSVVSLDSICHLIPSLKPAVRAALLARTKRGELIKVIVPELQGLEFWTRPQNLEQELEFSSERAQILSPFDPLVIQRKRLKQFFDYDHLFEAYIPKEKRKLGYFALPVLINDKIVAAVDLKADRARGELLIQKWTWMPKLKSTLHKRLIEEELVRFEKFQLVKSED